MKWNKVNFSLEIYNFKEILKNKLLKIFQNRIYGIELVGHVIKDSF